MISNNVEINKQAMLSEHFTLGEMTKTSYHTADGNIPSRVAIENLINLCENWLEDLRFRANQPIVINSGYRSVGDYLVAFVMAQATV